MTYIKSLVMKGFKSFARKTEIPFVPQINVVLGPNGSGKSNITDALCFVLGRISAKSMRAAKSSNLIFMGNKAVGAASEASVELTFDNSDKSFSYETGDVTIKRIVRKNGQSIYKINDETKTRQDVLSLMAQAGIDPNGFNIILQGEIQNFVRMHTEERRKIIEEISGISFYEVRKEKSLNELGKTDDKLKEIATILRERTSYINNLEKERQQALRFQKLQENVKKYKGSIILQDLRKKKKEVEAVKTKIEGKNADKEKIKKETLATSNAIGELEANIISINSKIQNATGLEQEKLNQEIANLRADLEGLKVRLEGDETKLADLTKQKENLKKNSVETNEEIEKMQKESPGALQKRKELEVKKNELEKLELERKKFYMVRSEFRTYKDRLEDRHSILKSYENESNFLLEQIKSLSKDLFDRKTDAEKLSSLKVSLAEKRELIESLDSEESKLEKVSYSNEHEIDNQKDLIVKISKMDVCPVCKNKITEEHVHNISSETNEKIEQLTKEINNADTQLGEIQNKKQILRQEIDEITLEISKRESDLRILSTIEDRKNQIKTLQDKIDALKSETAELQKKKTNLEKQFDENSDIERRYEDLRLKIQDIPLINQENISSEISFKQRELERTRSSLRQLSGTEEEIKSEISRFKDNITDKEATLAEKKKQDEELTERFRKLIEERDNMQKGVRDKQVELSHQQNKIHNIESEVSNLKIEDARFSAELENYREELKEFEGIPKIKASREELVQKLYKTQEILSRIGSVNLRSLEVYEEVKKEYDSIKEKMETIGKEKEGILRIIHEIDIRKKKTFLKTFTELNEIFSRNFSEINTKGTVSLELENKKEPFEGGVNIVLKTGHGKYFDVTSLSGGEQTMVALSLIFAIQELKPYPFYLLDEIDAALDKRNSERLALLLKKYMEKGQYIAITHNDEVILNATNLYGVSMNEGISKVISLKV